MGDHYTTTNEFYFSDKESDKKTLREDVNPLFEQIRQLSINPKDKYNQNIPENQRPETD